MRLAHRGNQPLQHCLLLAHGGNCDIAFQNATSLFPTLPPWTDVVCVLAHLCSIETTLVTTPWDNCGTVPKTWQGWQRAFPTRIHWGNVYEKKRYNVWNEIQKHWPPTYDSSLKWYGWKEEGEAFWCHNQGQDMPSSIVESDISAWYNLEMKRIFI